MGSLQQKEQHMNTENTQIDWHAEYMDKYYWRKAGSANPWDDWADLIRNNVAKGSTVLEVGGGPVDFTTQFIRENAKEVVGVDVDPVVKTNQLLDEAFAYDGESFPLPNNRFDAVVSRWVNEHVPNPEVHFSEIHRVLVPGGLYIFRTVNKYHYTALVARFTPHWLQILVVRWLKNHDGKDHYDAYATFYRANSRKRIEELCAKTGFEVVSLKISEYCSGYGKGSKLLFYLFMWYERLVNSTFRFEILRHTVDCVLRKSA